jgi:hypothetical protein
MSAPIFIRLTPGEDARLLEPEKSPLVHPKVRLRALEIRLSAQGWTAPPKIADFVGRDRTTVVLDLRRWLERKFEGLADGGPLRGRRAAFGGARFAGCGWRSPKNHPPGSKLIFGNF